MEPALSTVAVARQVCAAVSGRFAGGSRDNCLATVEEGGRLRVWSAAGDGRNSAVELAQETLPAAVHCAQAVRYDSVEMLFMLHAGMRWRLLQLDGAQLRERAAGTLEPPEREPEETLFECETAVCCTVRRCGKPDCILLATWDRWLTVLPLDCEMRAVHMPLAGAAGLPTSAGLPPRVLRLAAWAGGDDTICDSAADPLGNPAVAVLYADEGLRLLSVQCVNLDVEKCEVLPGPWGLQNVAVAEAERSCDLVPVVAAHGTSDVGSGVLVVGQDLVTYVSGDGEQMAQIPFSKLPGRTNLAKYSVLPQWRCCQVSPAGSGNAGIKVLLVGGEFVLSPAAYSLHIFVGSRAARVHCGSGGADAVEIEASKVALPNIQEPSQQRRFIALVPGNSSGQVVGCTADGRVIDFTTCANGSVAKEMTMMPGWWSEEGQSSCTQVLATACVPLTRIAPAVSSGGQHSHWTAPTCEDALAVCGVHAGSTSHVEGGCIALGRFGCARVATTPNAASFPELPSGLHALLLPDGTSLILCSFSGTTRGTQVLSMREDSAPPVKELALDQAAPTLATGFMGRAGIVQVTDEALHLIPASGLSSDTSSQPQRWTPSSAGSLSIGAAAVCEFASLVAVGVGSNIICCCPSSTGISDSPFEEVCPRFTCDDGQIAALQFYTPTAGQSHDRSLFLGYAEWGTNRVGLLNVLTMQPVFQSGPIVLQAPSLCRSIAFLEGKIDADSAKLWMLVGLADGQVLCYSMDYSGKGSESQLVLEHAVCVGSSPVELHFVAKGSEPGQAPYIYASSSRDLVLSAGPSGELRFADVAADDRTLLAVPTNGIGGYGGMAWVSHPQSGGAPCAELSCGYIEIAERFRWQRRKLEGHTPRHIAFHPQSHTLVVVTEASVFAESDGAFRPTPGSSLLLQPRQMIRVLDAVTLEQLAMMELEIGHTVDQIVTELPVGLLPGELMTGDELLIASSLYRHSSTSETADGKHTNVDDDVQSLLSVLRVTASREHENARVAVKFSLVAQHILGGGGPSVVSAMCPYRDRHSEPVLAVVRGCNIEVLRLNSQATNSSMGTETDDKAKWTEKPIGEGEMEVTCVTQLPLKNTGGGVACSLSAVGGYLLHSVCSGPATGQSILRWHDDLRLTPQLLIVSLDRVRTNGERQEAQRRSAAVARLLPYKYPPSRSVSRSCNTDENHRSTENEQEGSKTYIGDASELFVVVAPLAGGLRVLKHEAASELSVMDGEEDTNTSALGLASASASTTVGDTDGIEQAQEPAPELEPATADPTADDLLAMAAGVAADSQSQHHDPAEEDVVGSRPYELNCCFEQRAEGGSHSLRPVVGIHVLSGGRLGVRPLEVEGGTPVAPGLMVVRDDGTVQVLSLPTHEDPG